MRGRRSVRAAVAVGITTFCLGGLLAAPAAAPRITILPPTPPEEKADCRDGKWAGRGYLNQGNCMRDVPKERR